MNEANSTSPRLSACCRALAYFGYLTFLIALALLGPAGCVLVPDSVRPEAEHLSHITQHQPFTDHPSSFGADMVDVVAHWDFRGVGYLEVGEGVVLNRLSARDAAGETAYGEIEGPREQFIARVGLIIPVKP